MSATYASRSGNAMALDGFRSLADHVGPYAAAVRAPEVVVETVQRYRRLELEYSALRVVGRGLFLAVMLMVAFLFVMARATDLLPGANELAIPTVAVDPNVDLGELARGAFSRTSASVISFVGALTLVVSAMMSAQAVRTGSRRALLGEASTRAKLLSWQTALVAVVLAAVVLVTWLLTLATSVRHRAWVAMLGTDPGRWVVDSGKALGVLISVALIAGCTLLVVRSTTGVVTSRGVIASVAVAAVVVGANFFLLYTYVGALINPAVSAGIVLVLTLLVWVNLVVRTYLGALCWAGTPR
jgi:hypothetical protein